METKSRCLENQLEPELSPPISFLLLADTYLSKYFYMYNIHVAIRYILGSSKGSLW